MDCYGPLFEGNGTLVSNSERFQNFKCWVLTEVSGGFGSLLSWSSVCSSLEVLCPISGSGSGQISIILSP